MCNPINYNNQTIKHSNASGVSESDVRGICWTQHVMRVSFNLKDEICEDRSLRRQCSLDGKPRAPIIKRNPSRRRKGPRGIPSLVSLCVNVMMDFVWCYHYSLVSIYWKNSAVFINVTLTWSSPVYKYEQIWKFVLICDSVYVYIIPELFIYNLL